MERIGELTGRPLHIVHGPPRDGDIRDSLADLSRAQRVLGYQPVVSFEEGLRMTCEWYLDRA